LGPEHSAPARLTLAQAFNSIGCTIAPIFAGAYILTDPESLTTQAAVANTVKVPYILIAGALLLLGLALAFMHLPHVSTTQEFRPGKEGDPILSRSIFSYKQTVLGAMGIFLYVGVEVGLASIAVNYFKTQGMSSFKTASFLLSLYWFGALVGRLLGSWMLTKIQAGKLLGIFGSLATAMILVSMFTNGSVAIYSLVLCGFFNSIMFPNIFALGIAGLGPMTSKGSGPVSYTHLDVYKRQGEAGEQDVFAVASGSAGDAGDDAEDGAEPVVDAVNGVADPCAGLLAALIALGQHLLQNGFSVEFVGARGGGVMAAEK